MKNNKTLVVRVPASTADALRKEAEKKGVSISWVVRALLQKFTRK